jgi:hypothetical protein
MGQNRPGFPRELLCALIRLSYDGPITTYCCRSFQAHGLIVCEVQVDIPFNPIVLYRGAVIAIDLDDGVEKMAQMTHIAFCERHLADTASTPLALLSIQKQEDPLW